MVNQESKYSRQILAFGDKGQRAISSARIGIVGLGGIGSCILQMVSHLGALDLTLVDDDCIEESNMNRLIGAIPSDTASKTKKTAVAQRVIQSINPKVKEIVYGNLRSEEVLNNLDGFPDIIFGCVDNDSARLILTDIAAAYNKTLIDCATEIEIEGDSIINFGGRVVVARPGDYCLRCADQIDIDIARQELESDQERQFRHNHGYGLGPTIAAPAVISLNQIIAGLAVTELLMLLTGIREPERMLTYKGLDRGKVVPRTTNKKPDCIVCNSLVGKRDRAGIGKYLRTNLPKDLPK